MASKIIKRVFFSLVNIIDANGQLNFQHQNDLQLSYTLIHNAKYLPQLEIQYTQSSAKGQVTVTATLFEWITLEGDVVGKLDLSYADITVFTTQALVPLTYKQA